MAKYRLIGARTQLFLKYLGYSLGPLIVMMLMGVAFIALNQRYSRLNAENVIERGLDQLHTRIDMVLGELDSVALGLSTDHQLLSAARNILREPQLTYDSYRQLQLIFTALMTTVQSRAYLHSIYVYVDNPNDRMISTARQYSPLRPAHDTGWIDPYLERGGLGSTQAFSVIRSYEGVRLLGIPDRALTMYRPTFALGFLRPDGVVALNVDLDYLYSVVRSTRVYEGQHVLVSTTDGQEVLFVPGHNVELSGPNARTLNSLSNEMENRSSGFVEIEGTIYLLSHMVSETGGWRYVSVVPQSVVYRIPHELRTISILLFLVALTSATGLTIWLSRRSFLQMGQLVDVLDEIERQGGSLPKGTDDQRDRLSEHLSYSVMKDFVHARFVPIKASERRYRRRTLELLAMQSQVSPHFLYNTLEMLTWKSYEFTGGPNEITTIVEDLAEILDYALSMDGEFRALADEVQNAKRYLELQARRKGREFSVTWNIDPVLEDVCVIPMLILPLVENSIQHGFHHSGSDDQIRIEAVETGPDRFELRVIDNGEGIDTERLVSIRDDISSEKAFHEHIGLYNTNKRVELAYGSGPWGLHIDSMQGESTTVRIVLPILFF
ncbi:MAG: sensor histidine kinase [Spirochaetaceae bacterium]|nr:MAG: sensor histidine kinase [Spirochaetaceae bacterium]